MVNFTEHNSGIAQVVAFGKRFSGRLFVEIGDVRGVGVGGDGGFFRARYEQVDLFFFSSFEYAGWNY